MPIIESWPYTKATQIDNSKAQNINIGTGLWLAGLGMVHSSGKGITRTHSARRSSRPFGRMLR
jgi:hypothetical protein